MELMPAEDESQQAAAPQEAPLSDLDVEALSALVDLQAALVRAMKAEGRAKDDPELASAVATLLFFKAELGAQAPAP